MGAVASAVLADAVLIIHFAFVVFVVFGLLAILAGRLVGWTWIKRPVFRNAHLLAIGVVVLQAWLGRRCPLTSWESALRRRAGQAVYEETFVQHWIHRVLFFDAPAWVFIVLYTLFGALVLGLWLLDRRDLWRRDRCRRFPRRFLRPTLWAAT